MIRSRKTRRYTYDEIAAVRPCWLADGRESELRKRVGKGVTPSQIARAKGVSIEDRRWLLTRLAASTSDGVRLLVLWAAGCAQDVRDKILDEDVRDAADVAVATAVAWCEGSATEADAADAADAAAYAAAYAAAAADAAARAAAAAYAADDAAAAYYAYAAAYYAAARAAYAAYAAAAARDAAARDAAARDARDAAARDAAAAAYAERALLDLARMLESAVQP